jgi:two-component system, chemotaxis family, chemotaxis protein CheY
MSAGQRVLIVEDDESIREMLELVLESEGYEVTSASDGAAALALLEQTRPDLILLDMKMPVMDGWEFIARYRALTGAVAPVIVLTAAQDDSRRAAEVGAHGYLAKPFAIDDLLRAMRDQAASA